MTTQSIAPRQHAESGPPVPDDGVEYPDANDVLPVKSMIHFVPQIYMQSALETWLDDTDTLVAGQMFIYYEPGNPRACVAPDVYIIPRVGNVPRNSYFLWLEHETPTFAVEISSPTTYRNDLGSKADLYASWGVQEYWQYDPQGRLLSPLLQGSQLVNGRYQPMPVEVDPDGGRCVSYSPLLKLEMHARRDWFRFRNPGTGQFLRNLQESERQIQLIDQGRLAAEQGRLAAEQALDQERAARQELESLLRQHGIEPPGSGA